MGFKNMFTTGLWDSRICLQQVYGIQEYVYSSRFIGFKNMFTPGFYGIQEYVYCRFTGLKNMFTPPGS